MTLDMVMGLVRQVIPFLGAVAVTTGLLKPDVAGQLVNLGLVIAGGVLTLIGTVWTLRANTPASILQSANDIPSVRVIETTDQVLAAKVARPKVRVVRRG